MKWLILLALVASCGKQTEPRALDLHDSDGDQIQNYEESEFDKYVANFESLKEVKGVLKVFTDKQNDLSFSNQFDTGTRSLDMITGNENQLQVDEYFSEWSMIEFKKTDISFTKAQYIVNLEFQSGSDTPHQVILINGNTRANLGVWSKSMELKLSGETLQNLINGTSHLALVKKFERSLAPGQDSNKTIKEKTYRVLYNNDSSSKVFYVSKELSFDRFLEMMKVESATVIDEDMLFFNSQDTSGLKWYVREMLNGDKVIVKMKFDNLRHRFLQRFNYSRTIIGRENGKTNGKINFQNKQGAKVYLNLKSFYKTHRTFVETQEIRGGGGGGREGNAAGRCTIHRRLVKSDEAQMLNIEELANEIMTPETFIQERVEIKSNDSGTYWQMKLDTTNPNSLFMFKALPTSSYVSTGEIRSSCDFTGRMQDTNLEGKLSLEVESYVEKID